MLSVDSNPFDNYDEHDEYAKSEGVTSSNFGKHDQKDPKNEESYCYGSYDPVTKSHSHDRNSADAAGTGIDAGKRRDKNLGDRG